MRIQIVTPASRGERRGNRVTALRWALQLRRLGHRVRVVRDLEPGPDELLVVIHAVKGAAAALAFAERSPRRPLVLALSGTDVHGGEVGRGAAARALELADRIVALQPSSLEGLPPRWRAKSRVILQSAPAPPRRETPRADRFEVVALAHLRAVKDPFLLAEAARELPAASRVLALHAGSALDPGSEARALEESRLNPRWRWLGPQPRASALALLARARLFVSTSLVEGGSNALSEALACGAPVLATRIPGNVGVLGPDHPGLFPPGDAGALAAALERGEQDPAWTADLRARTEALAAQVSPEREREAWRRLIAELA